MRAAGAAQIVTVTGLAFFLPAAALSAIPPMVVKVRLSDLDETGTVVGGFSAAGTLGAIFGTFITGFVLLAAWPTRPIILFVGGVLVLSGLAISVRRWRSHVLMLIALPAVVTGGLLATAAGPCDRETVYHCASVVVDGIRPSGRVLILDGTGEESYVDLSDPTYLDFDYTNTMADTVAAMIPAGPIDVLFIGGGGFTLPRYFPAIRPNSTSTVFEIDRGLVELSVEQLGPDMDAPSMSIRVGDARLLLGREPEQAYDVVVGDAFSGLAVPWHLTTEEFLHEIDGRLRRGGLYVLNVIDHGPLRFVRAELATLALVFTYVALIAPDPLVTGVDGGNFVLVGSQIPIDAVAIAGQIASRDGDEIVYTGSDAAIFIDGASRLRDDFAPVDQLVSLD